MKFPIKITRNNRETRSVDAFATLVGHHLERGMRAERLELQRAWRNSEIARNNERVSLQSLTQLAAEGNISTTLIRRFSTLQDIIKAQRLYYSDGFAKALVNLFADFAVGDGLAVRFQNPVIQKMFDAWRPIPQDNMATFYDAQKLAAVSVVRDGDAWIYKQNLGGMNQYLQFLDARMFPSWYFNTQQEGAVVLDQYQRPQFYEWRPWIIEARIELPDQIPANQMIHLFDSTEYAGQVRGISWIQQSLPYLELLDAMAQAAYELSILNLREGGFYIVPQELLTGEDIATGDETDEELSGAEAEEEQIANMVLKKLSATDKGQRRWFPEGIGWQSTQSAGFTSLQGIEYTWKILIQKAARGARLSPAALVADFGSSGGYLTARYGRSSDEYSFKRCQNLVIKFTKAAVDWWLESIGYPGADYRITPTRFEFVDPAKEMIYIEAALRNRLISPQIAIEGMGRNVHRVLEDWYEWEKLGMPSVLPDKSTAEVDSGFSLEQHIEQVLEDINA